MFNVSETSPFPTYYTLDIESDATIVFYIPTPIWDVATGFFRDAPIREQLAKDLNLSLFIFPEEKDAWGFGSVLKNFPSAITGFTKICYEPRQFTGSDGFISPQSWNHAYGVVASIQFLLECAQYANRLSPVRTGLMQQVELEIIAHKLGLSRKTELNGGLSNALCDWITAQNVGVHEKISGYMGNAYLVMHGSPHTTYRDTHDCFVTIQEHCSISFHVPGQRTGIGSYHNHRRQYGLNFTDHNIDNPIQAITLLTGLATLCHYAQLD